MARIYIVDDDPDIVDFLSLVLKKEGHTIGFQLDESDVAEKITAFETDLIILDVIFPENDSAGFEIARELKHDDRTNQIPIIILSAVNQLGNYSGSFSNKDKNDIYLPIEEFAEKPIEPHKLVKMVNKLLISVQAG